MRRIRCTLLVTCWLLAGAVWPLEGEGGGLALAQAAPTRPDPEGVPTRVSLGFLFVDVTEINDLEQEFTADVFFRMRWRDARLALPEAADPIERVLPLDAVWNPQPGSLNRREVSLSLPQIVTVDADGVVTYSQRVYGSFAARMDLRRFPADTQSLQVQVASYRHSPEEVDFEIELVSGLMEQPSVAGWQVAVDEPEIAPLIIGTADRQFAAATFRLSATREVGYYILTMGLPLLFIALMAWAVFWIDPSLLPPQVGISTAAVFSLIAYRFSLKLSLPRISYLTTADWFVLAVTVLVFVAFANVIVVGRLAKTERQALAVKIDRWGRWIYLALLTGLVVALVI